MIAIRDHFGIKPLFYAVTPDGGVFFASEIKALLALGVPAAWERRSHWGSSLYIFRNHERTLFAGIRSVLAGCYAVARGAANMPRSTATGTGTSRPRRKQRRTNANRSRGRRRFPRSAQSDAVRERMVADVEVGCYLSGGINSCAVLGLSQRGTDAAADPRLHPRFRQSRLGRILDRPQASLQVWSARPITRCQSRDTTSPTFIPMPSGMPKCRSINGHGAAKFLLSKAVRDAGLKVVFTGGGSDELLGG